MIIQTHGVYGGGRRRRRRRRRMRRMNVCRVLDLNIPPAVFSRMLPVDVASVCSSVFSSPASCTFRSSSPQCHSEQALEGLITHETVRLPLNLSRANTLT
jgi:hypothetical protein